MYEEKYVEERKQVIGNFKDGSLADITSLTAFIAPVIGTAPSLMLPVIVLILNSAFKNRSQCLVFLESRRKRSCYL